MALNLLPLKLAPVATLTASAAALFTAPASGVSGIVVKKATIGNISAGNGTFTIWLVPSGGSVANSNLLCPTLSLANNATYIVNELNGVVLNPGDAIWGMANATSTMNFNASGYSF